jgi:hypothetical protein
MLHITIDVISLTSNCINMSINYMAAFTSCVPHKNYVAETDLECSRHCVAGVSSLDETARGIPASGTRLSRVSNYNASCDICCISKKIYVNAAHLWWMHMQQNSMTSKIFEVLGVQGSEHWNCGSRLWQHVVLYESLYYKTVQCHNPIVVH